jgi:hypothetical protein
MKLIIIVTIIFMLLLPVISFSATAKVEEDSKIEIKVSIINGTWPLCQHTQFKPQKESLENYQWTINDQTYEFVPKIYKNGMRLVLRNDINRCIFLSQTENHTLVLDGGTWDGVRCGGTDEKAEKIREQYWEYIDNGGGYVGMCGGGHFPLPLNKAPDTGMELRTILRNSFLKGMYTRGDGNFGWIISSEWLGVKKYGDTHIQKYQVGLRDKQDPAALGTAAYCEMNRLNNLTGVVGIPVNLTDLDKTHPILKDYWGDSLFGLAYGGSSYIIKDNYVRSLASYPADYAEHNESTQINAWSFAPKGFRIARLVATLCNLIIDNQFGFFYIEDLPNDWQSLFEEEQEETWFPELIDLLGSHWAGWKKTNTIVETGNVNPLDDEGSSTPKTAIIAFNYEDDPDKGRMVISGPHPFTQTFKTWHGGEIINHDQEKLHTRKKGMYHWVNKTNDWISTDDKNDPPNMFDSRERDYSNNTWYFRRAVAWASGGVPDEHLPPIYGRSQVVDIDPYMQYSQEISIYCCVADGKKEDHWNKINLSLYYKHYSDTGFGSGDWIYYDSITDLEDSSYKFNFNSPNGSGLYRFCSVLNTTNENDVVTIDDFPPMWDAEVIVYGNISAQFELENKYPYAKDSISFNSSDSSTKPGTQITSYHWDFGDGNNSTDANPTHTYNDDGIYTVNLTIQNNISDSNSTIKTITVHNNPPNISFTQEYKVVFVNEAVNFTDDSSDVDGNVTNWS